MSAPRVNAYAPSTVGWSLNSLDDCGLAISPVPLADEVDTELLDVAESCPTEAITMHDSAGTLLAPEV